jgi:hypothetical protein
MHTTSFHGATFTYNSDLSGPLIIATKGHSIEASFEAIADFVDYQRNQRELARLEKEWIATPMTKN